MDGNGRWAKKRSLPRIAGHRVGLESLRAVIKACDEFKVKYLTVYAFSTENWGRPKEEVDFLMQLIEESIRRELEELNKNNVKVRVLGRISEMDSSLRENILGAVNQTKDNSGLNVQIMLNYGGRAEIVDAVKKIAEIAKKDPNIKIDEDLLSNNMYSSGIPDPDLLIRTGGDFRVSNFLLWQIAYTEIYVTEELWPDFRKESLIKAIENFSSRQRRFGRV